MAKSLKTVTSKISDIQSKAQETIQSNQKKVVSSTKATQEGSTTTPTVTDTPKVASTAKAMPSITRPDISSIVPAQTTTQPTTTVNAKDLLGSKAQVTPLKKAATPDLLSTKTEEKEVEDTTIPLNIVRSAINVGGQAAQTIADSLYNQGLDWINSKINKLDETRQKVTDTVGKTAIDLFKGVGSDLSQQWQSGEGLGATKNAVLNTVQGLPRGIARIEYGVSELLDWVADTDWSESIKQSFKSDLEYWENTKTYQKVKETESFSDFLKNPLMYAGGTLGEMLPMFINAWVAVPTTFAQIYGETYSDYSQDTSLQEAGLSDNQVRLMSLGVAGVNTIIELGSDLVQGLMPWTKTVAKGTEKEIRRSLSKPIANIFRKVGKGGISEGFEEVFQDEILNQVAGFFGSDREMPTRASRLTTWGISSIVGGILQGGNVNIEINKHKELKAAFNEWSEAVDDIAPGVSQKDKQALFSAIVAAQVEDMQMSEDKVNKYEAETTELYNAIEDLTNQLETATDEKQKEQIQNQIDLANKRITTIDEMINKAKKVEEEVTAKLQSLSEQRQQEQEVTTEEELPATKLEIVEPDVALKNLSTQTMKDVYIEPGKLDKMPSTPDDYDKLYNELRSLKPEFLKDMKYNEVAYLINNAWEKYKEAVKSGDSRTADNAFYIVKRLFEDISIKKDAYAREVSKNIKVKNAKDYIKQMVDLVEKKNGLWNFYSKDSQTSIRNQYMSDFIRSVLEGDFARHLPGLKGIDLKQLEGKLTDENVKKIAKMLALVSKTFGIDFNKVIKDKSFSMNVADKMANFTYNTHTLGKMSWKGTKEQIEELMKKKGEELSPGEEILRLGVIITLNEEEEGERGLREAAATMAHELWHLIDIAISTEEGLPLYYEGDRITFRSIIDGDEEWNTFKYGLAGKNTDTYKYYTRPTEVLARYAEQFYAYINDEDLFNDLASRDWRWSREEFEKLLPKFEELITKRIGAKMLDMGNEFYYDVMSKINQNEFRKKSFEFDKEGLNEATVQKILNEIETEYAWILQSIEGMQGDIKEEMEAYVQLSTLQSDYEMAKAKGEEYLKLLETTPQQQEVIDNITETVVPEPPQNPETIMYGLPYFGGSNIEEGIGDIIEGGNGTKLGESYMKEEDIIKIRKKKKKIVGFFKDLRDAGKDVFTPTFARIYKISPRIAGRLHVMESMTEINKHRYRMKAKGFVESLGKLKGNNALEVKMALLDYGALASEQGADIEQYKKEESAKLREVLLRNGFKEKDINDMFEVLNDIGKQYQEAGLDITLTDMYFPRVVKDYEGLIDYMNRVSGKDIKVNKTSLLIKINKIKSDPKLTDEEKERKIRNAISIEFKQPGTTSQHGKERKMGKLSDWGEGIFAYYENPIEALDHYIVSMTNAIQRQLFLGGMKKDADFEGDIINQSTEESVSNIIGKLVEEGQIDEDYVNELQKTILAVINKKKSPMAVTAIKDITYISTITNFLSAINQLDDLGVVILKDRSGLKHIAKTIFGKAGIKYDDLGLDDAYEMFREEGGVTNWLFKKSFFNMFDRLGKTSFVNTAWESMIHQYNNPKTRKFLGKRLASMYGQESANKIMSKVKSKNYMSNGQIDIEVLVDLLYQLGSTQPIYTSSMPVTYLNHPWSRLSYALSSFTIKRINMLLQGAKEVYKNSGGGAIGVKNAGAWIMGASFFLAMFGAAVGDIGDYLKGKKEETFLWNLITNGIDEALAAGGSDMLDSWLKIWDLSEYDIKIFKQQGMRGLLAAKISPFIFDLGKDVVEAIWEHDEDEITDLAKYVPIFGKLTYYWFWDELGKSVGLDSNGFVRRKEDTFTKRDESGYTRRDDKGFIRRS